tara:strand:+ start:3496 stop:3696 length:201 start_codon:yes stop_codon:yes gene_type:complete
MGLMQLNKKQVKQRFSDEQRVYIRSNHLTMTVKQMADVMGKPADSVQRQAQRLGFSTFTEKNHFNK